jgi:glucose/mannose transport system permease protein
MFPAAGLNQLLDMMGLDFLMNKWYTTPRWGILAVTIAASWQFAGYVMALYLAGLRGINAELKEAAQIDGASTWQLYRRIIIPLLMPVTFTAIVLTGMGSIRVFDIPAVLGTGAAFGTDMLAFHMFQLTFQSNRIALGAVIASVMILLAALLIGPYLASLQLEEAQ